MKRRTFLRALAGGTVAALLGVQPRQLGNRPFYVGWADGWPARTRFADDFKVACAPHVLVMCPATYRALIGIEKP